MLGGLGIINLGPAITLSYVVALKIPMHQAMVILDTVLLQQLVGNVAELPPWSHIPSWPLSRHGGDQIDTTY